MHAVAPASGPFKLAGLLRSTFFSISLFPYFSYDAPSFVSVDMGCLFFRAMICRFTGLIF